MTKSALGRGLGALLGGVSGSPKPPSTAPETAPTASAEIQQKAAPHPEPLSHHVSLDRIRPSSLQPRKDFSPEALEELADSIRSQGIIQPLTVRSSGDGFELIAGERRWRAAQIAGLKEVPVVIREAGDGAVLELALIENLQRENLNPIEEATGYSQLIDAFNLTQDQAASKVGKNRVVVANALRLLKLAPQVQVYVRDGRLSTGHAKAILGISRTDEQVVAAEKVIREGWNVRQTEQFVAGVIGRPEPGERPRKHSIPVGAGKDAHVTDIENRLRERFGTKVQLRYREGKGALEIKFFNDDDLERILRVAGLELD